MKQNPHLPPGVTDAMIDRQIDDHDCHASPEDGCTCQDDDAPDYEPED